MKIEVLEFFLDGKDRYEEGDIRTVSQEDGEYFCSNGWAEDVEGKVATGERQTKKSVLDVRGTTHGQKADKVV